MSTHQLAALARTAEPRLMHRRLLALDAAVTGASALAHLALLRYGALRRGQGSSE
ncbi:hypothetical protein [Streptomyces sp. MH60]|uniref:hypothetical protein n=1 Tax=Streptomyces sp. MH60 TaxID=1940758 RepID=UPI000D48CA92|nr:hypothetical protein [Streptomyces sp. MH60]PPS84336.1 hypothetical protein BZZ08_04413 [Streptomyces sp. MH60]